MDEEVVSPEYRDSVLRTLKREPENLTCFQCGNKNPNWASVTLGLLICYNCTSLHRSLGTHISFVKSTELDKWTRRNLTFLELGGNHRAKEFFRRHGGLSMTAVDYSSAIAERYRLELEERVSHRCPRQSKSVPKPEPIIEVEPPKKPVSQAEPTPIANSAALPPTKNTVIHIAPVLPVSAPTYKFRKTKAAPVTQFKPVVFRPDEDEFQDCNPSPPPISPLTPVSEPIKPVQSIPRSSEKKAFSSDDFQTQLDSYTVKERMNRFSGARSISSAQYFGRDEDSESSLGSEASRLAEAAAEKASELKNKAVDLFNSLTQRFSS